MTLGREELETFVRALAGRQTRWEHLVRRSREGRSFERVWADRHVNAWLICWDQQHDTGWHDHDTAAAAILVLEGQIREERLRLAGPPITRVLPSGAAFYVPPSAIHRVLHAGATPAVTLHAYSPPLRRTGAYWLTADGELQRVSQSSEQELRAAAIAG